jgi:hypothetical protein
VLDTDGTGAFGWPQAPNLLSHSLVLNANLGDATGAFDSGPHWVPDAVWITLYVEDAYGNVTQQSGYLDHKKAEWKGEECINGTSGFFCTRGYERLVPPQEVPVVQITREQVGTDAYRLTGTGTSPDGRVVDRWWEINRRSFDLTQESGTETYRDEAVEVHPDDCEVIEVWLVYVDDRGQQGRAMEQVSRGNLRTCVPVGTPL